MVNEADEGDKVRECVLCKQEIADDEHYIVTSCGVQECGEQYSHQEYVPCYATVSCAAAALSKYCSTSR